MDLGGYHKCWKFKKIQSDKPTLNSLDQDSGKFHLKKMGPVSLKNVGDPVEVWEAKPDRRTAPH